MYNTINKQEPYYILNCRTNQYYGPYKTFEDVLIYVARHGYWNWYEKKYHNSFFDDYNCTGKDTVITERVSVGGIERYKILRTYLIFDNQSRIIDVRDYKELILKHEEEWEKICNPSKRMILYQKSLPEFRNGPVPGTGRHKHYFNYRLPKTRNEMRKNTDAEYREYTRAKRRHLPNSYDDIYVYRERNWKSQGKYKKQWQKNIV